MMGVRYLVGFGLFAVTFTACSFHANNTGADVPPVADAGSPSTTTTSGGSASSSSGTIVVVDAGGAVAEPLQALYAAQCLTELANGQVSLVISFYVTTSETPSATGSGGQLSMSLQPLALVANQPPTTFSQAGTTGAPLPPYAATLDSNESFQSLFGTGVTVPGAANPITVGADLVLSNAGLEGRFATDHFCARLVGHVVEPAAAARDLDPDKNFCIFDATAEGGTITPHAFADFSVANCPL